MFSNRLFHPVGFKYSLQDPAIENPELLHSSLIVRDLVSFPTKQQEEL
jgi:hypothetical protein